MPDIQTLLQHYGGWLVFFNVLAEQAGLPIPAFPMLVAAGALAKGVSGWIAAWLLATLACVLADSAWYMAGQRYGGRLLGLACKVSLSQDSCIRTSQKLYLRVGVRSLLVAKFLPGAGALSTIMAGLTGTPFRRFLAYDLAGSMLWAGLGVAAGALFKDVISDILDVLDRYGLYGLLLLGLALALYVAVRALRRLLLVHTLKRVPRLSAHELLRWQAEGRTPVVIDVRAGLSDKMPRIPGALLADTNVRLADLPLDEVPGQIVVYCSCPNEISAARLAARLHAAGFTHIWALAGGYEAWERAARENPEMAPAAYGA
ncbi:integral-membrane protein [Bordetella ansorpii]|uniref:Integral-membrane protein n=1 Tax=Bordetella ansorpii TaxID=288768 RepID=A0A157S834_9BORD|nr:VTT domain-containing protein [Bordetella ansorpii]SAI66582.1 integral-membrane protein [Bordetella ansorpii]